jgi:FG-GAP repeat
MRDGIPARRVLRLLSAGLALVASTGTAVGQSFEPELELADLLAANGGDGTVGFALNGVRRLEVAGTSVAGTGDVNGDGIDDVTIGARGANPNGTGSGRAYVVFGTDEGFPAELELADLLAANGGDGTQGFVLNGVADSDQAGQTVAGMGDINGDGIDDVLLNAPFADPNGTSSGQVYVVFGTDTGFPAELELSDLLAANGGDGTQGFALNGAAFDQAGYSIAWARDINDDGIDDILIGAPLPTRTATFPAKHAWSSVPMTGFRRSWSSPICSRPMVATARGDSSSMGRPRVT